MLTKIPELEHSSIWNVMSATEKQINNTNYPRFIIQLLFQRQLVIHLKKAIPLKPF